jgi:hypothetical protein
MKKAPLAVLGIVIASAVAACSAFTIADAHCQKFGRAAQVSGLDVIYSRLIFNCVTP